MFMQLIEPLKEFFDNINTIDIELGNPVKLQPFNYIALPIISDELHKLHLNLLEYIQPYVHKQFNPKYLEHNLSKNELIHLHTYGYHRIKEYFKPHITIGKYETKQLQNEEFELVRKVQETLALAPGEKLEWKINDKGEVYLKKAKTPLEVLESLRGKGKGLYDEYGGVDEWLRKERESWND